MIRSLRSVVSLLVFVGCALSASAKDLSYKLKENLPYYSAEAAITDPYLKERCKYSLDNTSAGNIWLPAEKYCRMLFLQQILEETKKSLIADEVRVNERIRGWLPEYACANVWPLVRTDANLRMHLPAEDMDLGRWPDRRFFWGIVNTFHPDWVESYVNEATRQRD